MKFVLAPLRLAALLLFVLVWLPVPALIASAFSDRGPLGETRLTHFNAALCLWNPAVWDAVWNSVVIASIATLISAAVGSGLARLTGPRRYWGRPLLRALAALPLVLGPFLNVLGLRFLADRLGVADGLIARFGMNPVFGISVETGLGWFLLIAGTVLSGSMWVAFAMEGAHALVDPRWVEAGRALGASRGRAWRDLVRPTLRPALAKACAGLFSLCLFDPGGPIAARLPRTLAGLILDSTLISSDLSRASVLVLIGLATAGLGSTLIRKWGGAMPSGLPSGGVGRPARASWIEAGLSLFALTGWSLLGLIPCAGFVLALLGRGTTDERLTYLMSLIYYELLDRGIARVFVVSAILGAATSLLSLPTASLLLSGVGRFPARITAAIARPLGAIPTLGVAVGALALARLSESILDPARNPGPLLLLASLGVWLPIHLRRAAEAAARWRPELAETALAFGASPRRANRTAKGPSRRLGVLVASSIFAATELSPALLLAPASDVRPLGPTVLDHLENPAKAAAIVLPIILLRVVAGLMSKRGSLTDSVH